MEAMAVDEQVPQFCEWTPIDDDVGRCPDGTPTVSEFYLEAREVETRCHSLDVKTSQTCTPMTHQIVSAISTHDFLPSQLYAVVLLGHCEDMDYVGHYIVDARAEKCVSIVSAWTQTSTNQVASTDRPRVVPLARIFFEVCGKPLHLWSALQYQMTSSKDGPLKAAPMLRLGCCTCNSELIRIVHETRQIPTPSASAYSMHRSTVAVGEDVDELTRGLSDMNV